MEQKNSNEQLPIKQSQAAIAANPMLCAVSHEDVAVMFLEWVDKNKYWRTAKRVGHNWFKLNSSEPMVTTTKDLFNIFVKESICSCGECSIQYQHKSDCAIHNMPAMDKGECDCR